MDVRSTIDPPHNLGLRVVAEGVESEEVRARLIELGRTPHKGRDQPADQRRQPSREG